MICCKAAQLSKPEPASLQQGGCASSEEMFILGGWISARLCGTAAAWEGRATLQAQPAESNTGNKEGQKSLFYVAQKYSYQIWAGKKSKP